MANVYYIGAVQAVAQVYRVTVGTATAGVTYSATSNGKSARYKAVAGDTTATICAALVAAIGNSGDGELRELRAIQDTAATAQFLVYGPSDGAPFSWSVASSTGTLITSANEVTGTSPRDASAVGNYSTGALPSNGDNLIFSAGSNGPMYNVTALNAITLAGIYRYTGFTGAWGLPDRNPQGYDEYRDKYLETAATLVVVYLGDTDAGQQFRLSLTLTGSPVEVQVTGGTAGSATVPQFEFHGGDTGSSLVIAGGSAGAAMKPGQASELATVRASSCGLNLGAGVVPGMAFLANVAGVISAAGGPFDALTVDKPASTVTVDGAASIDAGGTNLVISGQATVVWRSTGSMGDEVAVGAGSTLDLSRAPALLPSSNLKVQAGSTVNNAAGRITAPWDLIFDNCAPGTMTYTGANNETHTVA